MRSISHPCHELSYAPEHGAVRDLGDDIGTCFEDLRWRLAPDLVTHVFDGVPYSVMIANDEQTDHATGLLRGHTRSTVGGHEFRMNIMDENTLIGTIKKDPDDDGWNIDRGEELFDHAEILCLLDTNCAHLPSAIRQTVLDLPRPTASDVHAYIVDAIIPQAAASKVVELYRSEVCAFDEQAGTVDVFDVALIRRQIKSCGKVTGDAVSLMLTRPRCRNGVWGEETVAITKSAWGHISTEVGFTDTSGHAQELPIEDAAEFVRQISLGLGQLLSHKLPSSVETD